ncbi:uncharacterized protein LOC144434567 [Glandiceps talaboti]
MTSPMRMLIDCDCGTDDAEAIGVALSQPKVEVLGITCVFGNTGVNQVCRNVLRLLKVYNREQIPVFNGSSTSILNTVDRSPDHAHGVDGLGDVPDLIIPDMSLLQTEHAVNAIVRLVNQHPGEISLVCLGPLTNVAMAMRMDADLPKKLKDVTIMGGNLYGKANYTVCGEFNFANDPEAANMVLNSLTSPAKIITNDICDKHSFNQAWLRERSNIDTERAKFIDGITKEIQKFFESIYEPGENCPYTSWDGLAMVLTVCPDSILKSTPKYATVELSGKLSRAEFIVDWYGRLGKADNVNIIEELNMDIVKEIMLKSVM